MTKLSQLSGLDHEINNGKNCPMHRRKGGPIKGVVIVRNLVTPSCEWSKKEMKGRVRVNPIEKSKHGRLWFVVFRMNLAARQGQDLIIKTAPDQCGAHTSRLVWDMLSAGVAVAGGEEEEEEASR